AGQTGQLAVDKHRGGPLAESGGHREFTQLGFVEVGIADIAPPSPAELASNSEGSDLALLDGLDQIEPLIADQSLDDVLASTGFQGCVAILAGGFRLRTTVSAMGTELGYAGSVRHRCALVEGSHRFTPSSYSAQRGAEKKCHAARVKI